MQPLSFHYCVKVFCFQNKQIPNNIIKFTDNPQEIKPVQCSTSSDSPINPNTPCVFPFKIAGDIQKQCLPDVTTGNFWCPTKVNDNGEYTSGQGQWGFCSPSCPPYNQTRSIKSTSQQGTMFSTRDIAWRGNIHSITIPLTGNLV